MDILDILRRRKRPTNHAKKLELSDTGHSLYLYIDLEGFVTSIHYGYLFDLVIMAMNRDRRNRSLEASTSPGSYSHLSHTI